MTGSSILVVGATGTLGTRLVRQLAAAGVKPSALVRTPEKAESIASFARPVIGDLRAPETLAKAFRDAERVFIVAPPVPDMEAIERSAIDAAVAAGAKRIVYLSNFAATEGDPDLHVHVHGLHQRYVTTLGIEWTVLRPTRYMTNFPFVWRSVLDHRLLLEAGGSGSMSVIDPDDVAAIAVKALTEDGHSGQTYRLTANDAYTAVELARLLSVVLGHEIKAFEGGSDAFREALIGKGARSEFAPAMARYFAKVEAGLYPTTDTAAKLLGRAPRTYADWLEDNRERLSLPARPRPSAASVSRSRRSTVLVTGPTGKVGRRLTPLLARRGVTVRAAGRSPLMARAGVEPVHFDWADPSTYEAARKGVNAMYLVPGPIPQPKHAEYIRALLDGAAAAGVTRIVLLSSFGVDQAPPENPLRRIELAVESSGVPYTILRPVAFMQNFSEGLRWRESFVEGIRERDEIVGPGGNGIVSYVSTEDVAAVAAIALTEERTSRSAYALLGPEPLTLTQVADHISWATGRRIRYVETDRTPIRDALLASGAPPETAEHNSEVYVRAFGSSMFGVLNDDILNATGRPPVSFAEFAVGAAAAWRRDGNRQ